MSAELEARRTTAGAVLADFRRELASAPLSRPPGREWMFRLADALSDVLDQAAGLPAAQRAVLGQALADAITYRDPSGACSDYEKHPAGLCDDHAEDLDKTDDHLELARQLGHRGGPMTGIRRARLAALWAVAALVAAASLVSFAESYRGLFLWAHEHGLRGPWAAIWPLQVDVFIAVGELALFVALADRWPVRSRAAAWAVTVAGLAVSVAGNVGHIEAHSIASRATAAVPPLAAAALAVGLGVLKRVMAAHAVPGPAPAALGNGHSAPEAGREAARAFAAELAAGELPTIRRIRREMRIGQPKAQEVRAYLSALIP